MAKSLRSYLEFLEENDSSALARISKRVVPHQYEVTALLENLDQPGDIRIPWFQNIVDNHGHPNEDLSVVSNIFGSRERIGHQIGLPLGTDGMAVSQEYARLEKNR